MADNETRLDLGQDDVNDTNIVIFSHPIPFGIRILLITVISVLIIINNIINLYVLEKTPQIPRISCICLKNLSCADLLVGCVSCAPCIGSAILQKWPYGDVWCQIAGITHGCSVTVSIWSLALVSIDRYIAILHPLRYNTLMTTFKCKIIIVCMWILSGLTFLSPLLSDMVIPFAFGVVRQDFWRTASCLPYPCRQGLFQTFLCCVKKCKVELECTLFV